MMRAKKTQIISLLLSILEVDEEDEPDSDSEWDLDSDDETSPEVAPLNICKDKSVDKLCLKLRISLQNFSIHGDCEFLISYHTLVNLANLIEK